MVRRIYHLRISPEKEFNRKLKNLLGYIPSNRAPYLQSLTHSSVQPAGRDSKGNNERLEFLGDAVFDLVIADILFMKFPYKDEGFLTEMRTKIVSRDQLSRLADKMGLLSLMTYSPDLNRTPHVLRVISSNALEALIGAIYVDRGFNFAAKFIKSRILGPYINFEELALQEVSYKSKIYKWAQHNKKKIAFEIKKEFTRKGHKYYEIALILDGEEVATETNSSKKKGEELLAEKSCKSLNI